MPRRNALGLGDYGSEDEDDGPNPVLGITFSKPAMKAKICKL
jgi:hypothetical protein